MTHTILRTTILGFVFLLVGCGPTGTPVVEAGPEGIVTHGRTGKSQTYPWDDINGLHLSRQLNARTNKSYPVLRIQTEENPNIEVASSYSERVDSKAYAGMYIHLSIPQADFDELQKTIIQSAGLTVHPESDNVWVRRKDATASPPSDQKVYFKSIGS
jgi:hypothetical protein